MFPVISFTYSWSFDNANSTMGNPRGQVSWFGSLGYTVCHLVLGSRGRGSTISPSRILRGHKGHGAPLWRGRLYNPLVKDVTEVLKASKLSTAPAQGSQGGHETALLEGYEGSSTVPIFLVVTEVMEAFQGIDSASLCSLAGRYDNPIPTRFLAPRRKF
jgi:hypothetical protein